MKKPQKYDTFSQAFKRGQRWQGKPTCQDENPVSSPWNKLGKKNASFNSRAQSWDLIPQSCQVQPHRLVTSPSPGRLSCESRQKAKAAALWELPISRWHSSNSDRPTGGSQAPAQARTHYRAAWNFRKNTNKKCWTVLVITHGKCNGFLSIIYKATLVYNLWDS